MPSCVCLRSPNKYVSNPKSPSDLRATTTTNTADDQSLVTDSDVFDHQALLNQEGSTTYDEESYANTSPSNSSDETYYMKNKSNDQESTNSDQQYENLGKEKPEDLRKTVEKWNNLLKLFDENPDVQEVQNNLNMVVSMSEDEESDKTEMKKQIEETIKRLTSSLTEVRSFSSSQMPDKELVLQPYIGNDDETHFKCFLRNVKSHMGEAEVELDVNESSTQLILQLFDSLGLLSGNGLKEERPGLLSRMSSSIKSSTVFKNLFDPLDLTRSKMDLTTYLHQLSNEIDRDDLASVSTLSDLEPNEPQNSISNCLLNTSLALDGALCDLVREHNRDIPNFCNEQLKKQATLRNKYGDMSDLPLFIS
ncbi:uncharacterized protein TA06540 [Theileria annulata]|uniref:Uncharacterized protein n=1 Tax=Theileria annulata TaxID=5874 RepID=Q4UID8_THEAN|nr:uncharacterized protein TA06540 [Theileria annulata]CAI73151.1 hypothetical protein, conserved [Theileria annulata]|eukprot:XP_953829.1 hypothetical protein, conserved [Theileria annulata]